ncbi:cupin domain-containing protein [Planctobacterium marinum]|uniref:Mannose-6-phosphate isomerase n=1 Tax=Planctobacterium marinum TaxID=1631968 RepID=A0AA48KQ92_9ALTE|nr:mannose-6-phosphate isomerase [Planctobacterium marinum]
MLNKINIAEKFSLFDDLWSPKILGEANQQLIKIAKGLGQLVWHCHDHEDELFIVFKGELKLHLRPDNQAQHTVILQPGELFVVPQGMQHCPEADEETHFMMLEPKSTQHTGAHSTEQTKTLAEQIWI